MVHYTSTNNGSISLLPLLFVSLVLISISTTAATGGELAFSVQRGLREEQAASTTTTAATGTSTSQSKWARRTARKRQRIDDLLNSITLPPPSSCNNIAPVNNELSSLSLPLVNDDELPILQAPKIDWIQYPLLDPQQGGKLKPNSLRAIRKQRQVEAFVYVCQTIINNCCCSVATAMNGTTTKNTTTTTTIIDAGSGAGNLAIPLAGLLDKGAATRVLAIDVNEIALQKLKDRCPPNSIVDTLCADLANVETISMDLESYSSQQEGGNMMIVVSLHACGAATDMAIRLATQNRLPFCMSPCCTAKAMIERNKNNNNNAAGITTTRPNKYGPSTSFLRSGAPPDISYPRSNWLKKSLMTSLSSSSEPSSLSLSTLVKEKYTILAQIADIGLGPQTPIEQFKHQRSAKRIIEWDRLMGVIEQYPNYQVYLMTLPKNNDDLDDDHDDDKYYSKKELLIGIPKEKVNKEEFINNLETTMFV